MSRSQALIASIGGILLLAQGCGSSSSNNNTGGSGGGGDETGGSPGTGGSKTGGSGGAGTGGATGGSPGTGGASTGGSGGGGTGGGGSPDGGVDAGGGAGGATGGAGGGGSMTMSFFITSRGGPKGGDFRVNAGDMDGLAGADALCKELATAASAELGMKTWHAYLSTSTVNARDRIGKGPWRNAKGVVIANSVEQLHDAAMLNATWPMGAASLPLILDEKGAMVPTGGAEGQRHDILTGSNPMGMADGTNTCSNWTSTMGMAANGHFNRAGGGARPTSWNSAHTVGCGPAPAGGGNFVGGTVTSGGGRGSFYCFAVE